jgi:hypothetical protein
LSRLLPIQIPRRTFSPICDASSGTWFKPLSTE